MATFNNLQGELSSYANAFFLAQAWSGAYPRGGGIWGMCPPLESNAQRKNLRRLKDLKGPIQRKSPKFSK